MIRVIIGGAVVAALLSGPALAAARPSAASGLAWVINPTDAGCRVELELVGRSGAITPVSLISDGQLLSLHFSKDDLPARAFLPIRIDKARFSNLMLRSENGAGDLVLSEETEAAMRKGGTLGVAWLSEEPLTVSLAGSEQGLADLKVCGAQAVSSHHRERLAAEQAARERAEAEAQAKALNEAQLAALQAQTAAAEAQRRQAEEAAQRQRQAEAAAQERAYFEARQRAYEAERRGVYSRPPDQDDDGWEAPPQQPMWPPRNYSPY